MADFGFLSDTDDSAVDELISQVQELTVLEQVSAINCSGFTDSVLPTELESRFRKLKSFPLTKPTTKNPTNTHHKSLSHSKSELCHSVKPKTEKTESVDESSEIFSPSKQKPDGKKGLKNEFDSVSDEESEIFLASKQNPEGKFVSKEKSKNGSVSSPSSFSNSSKENEIFSASKQNSYEKKKLKSKSKSGSFSSPLGCSNSWLNSPSPPRKSGCFWCSPIRVSKKKSKEIRVLDTDFDWSKNDEFLSDLNTFSVKEQQKRLKKAMKEQQKISQEAEKIVKWAKQASARMSFHGIEDELSDHESTK